MEIQGGILDKMVLEQEHVSASTVVATSSDVQEVAPELENISSSTSSESLDKTEVTADSSKAEKGRNSSESTHENDNTSKKNPESSITEVTVTSSDKTSKASAEVETKKEIQKPPLPKIVAAKPPAVTATPKSTASSTSSKDTAGFFSDPHPLPQQRLPLIAPLTPITHSVDVPAYTSDEAKNLLKNKKVLYLGDSS